MIELRRKEGLLADDLVAPMSPLLLTNAQQLYDDWLTISSLPVHEQGRARQNLISCIKPSVPLLMEPSYWRYLSYGMYDF